MSKKQRSIPEPCNILGYYRQKAGIEPPDLSQRLGKNKNYCWRVENYGQQPTPQVALQWLVECGQDGMDVVFEYFQAVANDRISATQGSTREDRAAVCLDILLSYLQEHGHVDSIVATSKEEPATLTDDYLRMYPNREQLKSLAAQCVRHGLALREDKDLLSASENSLAARGEEHDWSHVRKLDLAIMEVANKLDARVVEKGYSPELHFEIAQVFNRSL